MNSSLWPIDWTLTGTATLSKSGPGSNGNEGVLYIPQSSRTGALQSDTVWSHSFDVGGALPLCRGAAGVFDDPSRLGYQFIERDVNIIVRHTVKKVWMDNSN